MSLLTKVVWSEGMYLAPHHFQAQLQSYEDAIHFAIASLWFKPYGLAACEMDKSGLQNGMAGVSSLRGLFPDGLAFSIPDADPAPSPRNVAAAFPSGSDSQVVWLGIAGGSAVASANGENSHPGSRYIRETRLFTDETLGRDSKLLEVGRKNFRLLLDHELDPGTVALPLARLQRSGAGGFVYDPEFVPPLLRIGGSSAVLNLLAGLCQLLEEKSTALLAARAHSGQSPADYHRNNFTALWLLNTVHSSLAELRHHQLSRQGHPEELFRALLRLGGALSCFALNAHPRDLPPYDHDDLTTCFGTLSRKIREWLEIFIPSNCASIPLRLTGAYIWSAAVDEAWTGVSRWILEVRSPAGEAEIVSRSPQVVKVCSEKFVPELVKRGMPGLPLLHLPSPPPAVPARADAQYFGITKAGPCWEHIVQTHRVGVYVPGEIPSPELAIHVVLER